MDPFESAVAAIFSISVFLCVIKIKTALRDFLVKCFCYF